MKLIEALKPVFEEDKKIRKTGWPLVNFVGMRDGVLSIFLIDGEFHKWVISAEDILSTDWMIL